MIDRGSLGQGLPFENQNNGGPVAEIIAAKGFESRISFIERQ